MMQAGQHVLSCSCTIFNDIFFTHSKIVLVQIWPTPSSGPHTVSNHGTWVVCSCLPDLGHKWAIAITACQSKVPKVAQISCLLFGPQEGHKCCIIALLVTSSIWRLWCLHWQRDCQRRWPGHQPDFSHSTFFEDFFVKLFGSIMFSALGSWLSFIKSHNQYSLTSGLSKGKNVVMAVKLYIWNKQISSVPLGHHWSQGKHFLTGWRVYASIQNQKRGWCPTQVAWGTNWRSTDLLIVFAVWFHQLQWVDGRKLLQTIKRHRTFARCNCQGSRSELSSTLVFSAARGARKTCLGQT